MEEKIKQYVKLGLCFGAHRSSVNPRMKSYISATKNDFHIIDADKITEGLELAKKCIKEELIKGNKVLFVGTNISARDEIKRKSHEFGMPFLVNRWLPGLLTNFSTILKRINRLQELRDISKSFTLDKITKKERAIMEKELEKLENNFGGLEGLIKPPSVIFLASLRYHLIAAKEAKKSGIKCIAVVNTDSNPDMVDIVIPANDRTKSSITYILNELSEVFSQVEEESKKKEELIKKDKTEEEKIIK